MSGINQKGIAPLILIVLALVGLVIGVWLVQNRTNFLPNAQFAVPNLTKETAFHLFPAGNFYMTRNEGNATMSQDSGGSGSSDSMNTDGNTSGSSGGVMPRRTWFYPGEEIRVNLAVSSDIDSANTFSAIINFPPDLLEVVSIQKENNGSGQPVPLPYPVDAGGMSNAEVTDSSGPVSSSEGRVCAAVITRACTIDNVQCIKAPCPPQEVCKDFPSPCDVPEGWVIKDPNTPPTSMACGASCTSNEQCAGAKDGCTTCLAPPDKAGRIKICQPPFPSASPTCKPIPPCAYSNPACDIDPSDPTWCQNTPSTQDYFIRFWLPDTGFDNNAGRVTLAGGVSGGGILTTPPSKPVMATITFKAKKPGEAVIYIADESVILRNSDSSNILTGKNKLPIQIQEKPVPPVIRGDLDGDGIVGFVDFSILLTNWGTDSKKADITGDGKVDIFDFSVMLTNWSGKRGLKPIQKCPEEWIQNMMPGVVDDSGATPREYFIYDGKRREMSEFDMDWVKMNCNIKPQPVY